MFWVRLASGITLLCISIAAMSVGKLPLLLVLLLCSLIAYRELTKAMQCATDEKKLNALEIVGLLGVLAYYAAAYFSGRDVMLLMCIVAVFLAEMFLYVVTFPKYKAEQVAAAVFAFLYAPLMLSFIYLTRMSPRGIYFVWLILISAWGSDTCAYAVGMLLGKRKIFPRLSPKKSLEGCIGGVVGSALIGWLYGYFWVERAFSDENIAPVIAFICAVGAVTSMMGDLAASGIKRNHNIKDYGNLIPGHGGIMDRFDSMTVTAPMVYFLMILLVG